MCADYTEDMLGTELVADAATIVDLVRDHTKDGSLTVSREMAIDAVHALMRTSYSKGVLDGTREMGNRAVHVISGKAQ